MKIFKLLSVLVASYFLYSCEDILETDIENLEVQLQFPKHQDSIVSNVVNFQWRKMEGATSYRIQLYSETTSVGIDTLVTSTQFLLPLSAGTYQWRVRGENFAYVSSYSSERSITVVGSNDLTQQQVLLGTPLESYYNYTQLTLQWSPLNAAQFYDVSVVLASQNNLIIMEQSNLTATQYTLTSNQLIDDGQYIWRVRATNAIPSQTAYSSKSFYIDRQSPHTPVLSAPIDASTIALSTSTTFSWTIAEDIGIAPSPIGFMYEIATDSSFSTLLASGTTSNTNFSYSFATAGTYFWRVRAKDQATNESPYSSIFKIIIQ